MEIKVYKETVSSLERLRKQDWQTLSLTEHGNSKDWSYKIRGEMGPLQQTSVESRDALGNILKSYIAKKMRALKWRNSQIHTIDQI